MARDRLTRTRSASHAASFVSTSRTPPRATPLAETLAPPTPTPTPWRRYDVSRRRTPPARPRTQYHARRDRRTRRRRRRRDEARRPSRRRRTRKVSNRPRHGVPRRVHRSDDVQPALARVRWNVTVRDRALHEIPQRARGDADDLAIRLGVARQRPRFQIRHDERRLRLGRLSKRFEQRRSDAARAASPSP